MHRPSAAAGVASAGPVGSVACGGSATGIVAVGVAFPGNEQALSKAIKSKRLGIVLKIFFSTKFFTFLQFQVWILYFHFLSVNVNVLPCPGMLLTSRLP